MKKYVDDIWGGLAAMLVALPSAIAFGVLVFSAISPDLAGQGALFGMIGAATLGLVSPYAGGTPVLTSAPCAPSAAILSGFALTLVGANVDVDRIPGLLALTALFAGLLQMSYGLIRGGQLIKYIPYPVVSGYMSGVGLIIAIGQLPKLLGVPKDTHFFAGLISFGLWRWPGIVVGIVTIIVMVYSPKVTTKVPAAILGLMGGIIAYFLIGMMDASLLTAEDNPLVIGPFHSSGSILDSISGSFSSLLHLQMTDVKMVASAALALSALLSIDTLKTCVVLDAMSHRRHNSNRELFGQGIGNISAFLTGGMPGAGTMGPTLVNFTSGGRSSLSGLMEGIFVVLAILILSPLIAWVPIGGLAGIMLVVAYRMFDWDAFRLVKHADTRLDFAVIAAVVIVAESVGLIEASATGIGLAILLFIRDQIRGTVLRRQATLKEVSSKTHRLESERKVLTEHGGAAAVVELQGNLFFGTTDQLYSDLEQDLKLRKWILLDMRRVQSLDYTATHLFDMMHDQLKERGGGLLFSGMPSTLPSRQDIQGYMQRVGLIHEEGGDIKIFETRDEAVEWMENQILATYGWTHEGEEEALDLGEIELLREFDEDVINDLRACAQEVTVPAGGRVFGAGEEGDEVFLIRRGVVRILLPLPGGKRHHLATFGRGDFFGEMSFLDRGKRSAEAVAKNNVDLYVISREEFNKHVYEDAVIGVRVFARVARAISLRLRQTDTELRSIEDR